MVAVITQIQDKVYRVCVSHHETYYVETLAKAQDLARRLGATAYELHQEKK